MTVKSKIEKINNILDVLDTLRKYVNSDVELDGLNRAINGLADYSLYGVYGESKRQKITNKKI